MGLLNRRTLLSGAVAGGALSVSGLLPTATPALAADPGTEELIDQKIGDLATIEELTHGTVLVNAGDGVNFGVWATSAPLFIAPFPCEVVWAALTVWRASGPLLATNNSHYWNVQLRRWRGGQSAVVAQKTTRATAGSGLPAGQGVSYRVPWTFNATGFAANARTLQTDDALDVAFYPTGTPVAWGRPVYGQLRYRPL